jgi:hypothetical protein
MMWISVRNWRKFQHYDPSKRIPPWIKNNTELLHDSAYLGLTGEQRSILHGLWLEYASARCRLPADSRLLTRRLNLRVTKRQLESLYHAGFIDFVASEVLAEGYQSASGLLALVRSQETEKEKEQNLRPAPAPEPVNYDSSRNGAGAGTGLDTVTVPDLDEEEF